MLFMAVSQQAGDDTEFEAMKLHIWCRAVLMDRSVTRKAEALSFVLFF